jgi:hypothetical protein
MTTITFENDTAQPLKKSKNRHGETCEEQLRRMCKSIADDITEKAITRYNGYETEQDEDDEGTLATRFMEDVYDIRYLVDREKEYMGAMLLVAGGGPTIWVNTWTSEVEGSWAGDRCTHYFQDNIGLDDYNEEMYNCS